MPGKIEWFRSRKTRTSQRRSFHIKYKLLAKLTCSIEEMKKITGSRGSHGASGALSCSPLSPLDNLGLTFCLYECDPTDQTHITLRLQINSNVTRPRWVYRLVAFMRIFVSIFPKCDTISHVPLVFTSDNSTRHFTGGIVSRQPKRAKCYQVKTSI
jgi:hypothetical protein